MHSIEFRDCSWPLFYLILHFHAIALRPCLVNTMMPFIKKFYDPLHMNLLSHFEYCNLICMSFVIIFWKPTLLLVVSKHALVFVYFGFRQDCHVLYMSINSILGLQVCCIIKRRVGRTMQAMANILSSTNLVSSCFVYPSVFPF